MSYTTIDKAVNDEALQVRVKSAASKEAWAGGAEFRDSVYGERIRTYPEEALTTFMYAVAIDTEADYAYAVDQGNPNPGGDVGVIGDPEIQAAVQVHWPLDPAEVPLPPGMVPPTPGIPVVTPQPEE